MTTTLPFHPATARRLAVDTAAAAFLSSSSPSASSPASATAADDTTLMLEVSLLDYGAGNVRSVRNAIAHLGFAIRDVAGPADVVKGINKAIGAVGVVSTFLLLYLARPVPDAAGGEAPAFFHFFGLPQLVRRFSAPCR